MYLQLMILYIADSSLHATNSSEENLISYTNYQIKSSNENVSFWVESKVILLDKTHEKILSGYCNI